MEQIEIINWNEIIKSFNAITGKKCRTVTHEARKNISERLKEGYKIDDIKATIEKVVQEEFHKENNLKFVTLEYISQEKIIIFKPNDK